MRPYLQDVRYVIHTITFFAVPCPENSAFKFQKKTTIFRETLRKILKIFEKLGHEKNAEFVVLEIPKIFGSFWRKLSEILAKSAKFWKKVKKQQNVQQFLTKILRLENGAKECIV